MLDAWFSKLALSPFSVTTLAHSSQLFILLLFMALYLNELSVQG